MDKETINQIIRLYKKGFSIRKIEKIISGKYHKESIRENLKRSGMILRGIGIIYKNYGQFSSEENDLFAELLGYLYGDGSLHKYKNTSHGIYDCHLAFSLNEADLVKRIVKITNNLFKFIPKVIRKKSIYLIKFRRSFAKYLANIGYPIGKKSILNPNFPLEILKYDSMKRHFICGFLNAEATVNETITVQQSVRINLPLGIINFLKKKNKPYKMNDLECYFIKFSKIKSLNLNIQESKMLLDLKKLLNEFGIQSAIYPIRLYIGRKNKTSIHFELHISPKFIRKIKDFNMLSCTKKVEKLNKLLQG
jgi:hypothetical protein